MEPTQRTDVTDAMDYGLHRISEDEPSSRRAYPGNSSQNRPLSGTSQRSIHSRPRSGGSRASQDSGSSVIVSLESVGTSSGSPRSVIDEDVARITGNGIANYENVIVSRTVIADAMSQAASTSERPRSGKSNDSFVTFSIESVGTPSDLNPRDIVRGETLAHTQRPPQNRPLSSTSQRSSGSRVSYDSGNSVIVSLESVGTSSGSARSVIDENVTRITGNGIENYENVIVSRTVIADAMSQVTEALEQRENVVVSRTVIADAMSQVIEALEQRESLQPTGLEQMEPLQPSQLASCSFESLGLRSSTSGSMERPNSTLSSTFPLESVGTRSSTAGSMQRPNTTLSSTSLMESVGTRASTAASVGGDWKKQTPLEMSSEAVMRPMSVQSRVSLGSSIGGTTSSEAFTRMDEAAMDEAMDDFQLAQVIASAVLGRIYRGACGADESRTLWANKRKEREVEISEAGADVPSSGYAPVEPPAAALQMATDYGLQATAFQVSSDQEMSSFALEGSPPDDWVVVKSVMQGMWAESQGLQEGDILLTIGEKKVESMSEQEMKDLLSMHLPAILTFGYAPVDSDDEAWHAAAVKIQSMQRGTKARKEVAELKADKRRSSRRRSSKRRGPAEAPKEEALESSESDAQLQIASQVEADVGYGRKRIGKALPEPGQQPEQPDVFEVVVIKKSTDKLGWTRQGDKILNIKEGGVIEEWNRRSIPDCQVLQGDTLISLNGIKIDQEDAILAELQTASKLRFQFKRGSPIEAVLSAQKVAKFIKRKAKLAEEAAKEKQEADFTPDPDYHYPLHVVIKLQNLARGFLLRLRFFRLEKAAILVQRQYRSRIQNKKLKAAISEDEHAAALLSGEDGGIHDEPRMYDQTPYLDPTLFCLRRCGRVPVVDEMPLEVPLVHTTFVGGEGSLLRKEDLHVSDQKIPAVFCKIEVDKRTGEVVANFSKGPFPDDIIPPAVKPVVSITIVPWAGPVGLTLGVSGEVQRVEPGSQAAIAGVKRRWKLKSIHGAPVSPPDAIVGAPKALQAPSLVDRAVKGGKTFYLHFEVDGLAAEEAISKKGVAKLCVGSRLRFGHTWWELSWKTTFVCVQQCSIEYINRCNTWADLERAIGEAGKGKEFHIKEIQLLASSNTGEVVVHISSASPVAPALRALKSAIKVGDFFKLFGVQKLLSNPERLPQPSLAPANQWPQSLAFKMMRSTLASSSSSPELRPGGPRKGKPKPRLLDPLERPGPPGSMLPGNASFWPTGAPDFCRFQQTDKRLAFALV